MPGTFCDVQHMFKFMIMFTWCFTMGEAHSLRIGIKGHYPKILAGLNYHHARSLILGMAPRCENKCGYNILYIKATVVSVCLTNRVRQGRLRLHFQAVIF
jgi:hypothetical protein